VPVSGKGWEKGKEDSGTGYLPFHTAFTHAGEAFRRHTGQKDQKGVGRTEHGQGTFALWGEDLLYRHGANNAMFGRRPTRKPCSSLGPAPAPSSP
jgi:hypothetical protein